jgi:transcriptional regulator with XRE-family HTH domain
MTEAQTKDDARLLTPKELALMCKLLRHGRGWTQEVLAEVAKVTVRTVQRVEQGEMASKDTLRALAGAFGAQDLDCFTKPVVVPTPEGIKASQEKFEAEHMTLAVKPVSNGRELAMLVTTTSMDSAEQTAELPAEAAHEYAALIDYYRDYRDVADCYSEVQKLEVFEDLDRYIDALNRLGFTLVHAVRRVRLRFKSDKVAEPWDTAVLYLMAAPKGKEPGRVVVARKVQLGI